MSTVQVGYTKNTKHIPVTSGYVDLKVNDYDELESLYPERKDNVPVGFVANASAPKNSVRALTAITVLTMNTIQKTYRRK